MSDCWSCFLLIKMFSRKRVVKSKKKAEDKESGKAPNPPNPPNPHTAHPSSHPSFFARILGNARGTASCIDLSKTSTTFSLSTPSPVDDPQPLTSPVTFDSFLNGEKVSVVSLPDAASISAAAGEAASTWSDGDAGVATEKRRSTVECRRAETMPGHHDLMVSARNSSSSSSFLPIGSGWTAASSRYGSDVIPVSKDGKGGGSGVGKALSTGRLTPPSIPSAGTDPISTSTTSSSSAASSSSPSRRKSSIHRWNDVSTRLAVVQRRLTPPDDVISTATSHNAIRRHPDDSSFSSRFTDQDLTLEGTDNGPRVPSPHSPPQAPHPHQPHPPPPTPSLPQSDRVLLLNSERCELMVDAMAERISERFERRFDDLERRLLTILDPLLTILDPLFHQTEFPAYQKSVVQLSASAAAGGQDGQSRAASIPLPPDVKEKRPLFAGRRDEKNKTAVDDFCQHIVKLPGHLRKDETLVGFFHNSSAPDEERAIELLRGKESSAAATKKTIRVGGSEVMQRLRETFRDERESGKADPAAATASSPSSSSPTSPSPSVAAAAVTPAAVSKPSFPFTNVEAAYEEIKDHPAGDLGRPDSVLASDYSEVRIISETTSNSRTIVVTAEDADAAVYADCITPETNNSRTQSSPSSSSVESSVVLRNRVGRPTVEEALYASVFKDKTTTTMTTTTMTPGSQQMLRQPYEAGGSDGLYEDMPVLTPSEEPVLYEDTTMSTGARSNHHLHQQLHQHPQHPPAPPKPRVPASNISADPDSKPPSSSPTKPHPSSTSSSSPSSAAASSSFTPLTPIPPMPQFPSPDLLNPDAQLYGGVGGGASGGGLGVESGGGEIQVVAIADYDSSSHSDSVLSFQRGSLATLLLQSDSKWWCIRLGTTHGWVPAAYWRMLNSGDCVSLVTRGNSPWFVGKLSRAECEALLMEHGKQQHFVVRESDSGHYALSIKYDGRIHHFPIELTPDGKYNIGKHDFKTVNNIILYYQKNALFHDEHGRQVTLGSPLVIIKH